MKLPITERRRANRPARRWSYCLFVIALITGWVAAFVLLSPVGETWHPFALGNACVALDILWRAVCELLRPYLPWFIGWLAAAPVLDALQKSHSETAFFVRVFFSLLTAIIVPRPLVKWRWAKTPRRLDTYWVGKKVPCWSEGSDAIVNANITMASGIERTGRGIEISPGVALSHEQEAKLVLMVGDIGSGKTVAMWQVIFQLRQRRSLLIIHDTKGDFTARWPDNDFVLLAVHDKRSWGWDIGRDIIGSVMAREFASLLIASSERAPNWPQGAREIFVGVVITLQREKLSSWGWGDLKAALDMDDSDLREFACRHNPAAARFLALSEDQNFTLNAGSYVSTLMAPMGRLISPLASAWADLDPRFRISLCEWLDQENQQKTTLILQRSPDLPEMSRAWIGAAVNTMTKHLLRTRKDRNPADKECSDLPEAWFLLDEFPQVGLEMEQFAPILELGRSLGIRAVLGVQNFSQLTRAGNKTAAIELLQLAGSLLVFHLNGGHDANMICDGRLKKARVRTWLEKQVDGKTIFKEHTEEMAILPEEDLSELLVTRDGAKGYLIINNSAFGLTWLFPNTPVQREGSIRAAWVRGS